MGRSRLHIVMISDFCSFIRGKKVVRITLAEIKLL